MSDADRDVQRGPHVVRASMMTLAAARNARNRSQKEKILLATIGYKEVSRSLVPKKGLTARYSETPRKTIKHLGD
jgi:hypothetical protein